MYIEKILFLKDFIIKVVFNGNHSFFYDFKPQMNTLRFKDIRSQELFENGKLEDGCRIVWDQEVKLEDYELLGYELFESNLYMSSQAQYNMLFAC